MFHFQLKTVQWVKIGVEILIEVIVSFVRNVSDPNCVSFGVIPRVLCSPDFYMAHNKHMTNCPMFLGLG